MCLSVFYDLKSETDCFQETVFSFTFIVKTVWESESDTNRTMWFIQSESTRFAPTWRNKTTETDDTAEESSSGHDSAVHSHLSNKGLKMVMFVFWLENTDGLKEEWKNPSLSTGKKPSLNWGGGLLNRLSASYNVLEWMSIYFHVDHVFTVDVHRAFQSPTLIPFQL